MSDMFSYGKLSVDADGVPIRVGRSKGGRMTHEERVRHHMYETCEGIAEQSERIASLEELVRDMWAYITEPVGKRNNLKERLARFDDIADRMRELGIEVTP